MNYTNVLKNNYIILSHLFCMLSCERVLAQMRGRTLGNSAARLRSYVGEQHTMAWINCCVHFMATRNASPPPALPQMEQGNPVVLYSGLVNLNLFKFYNFFFFYAKCFVFLHKLTLFFSWVSGGYYLPRCFSCYLNRH